MEGQDSNKVSEKRKRFPWKTTVFFLLTIVLIVVIVSVFIAGYEPDPQDTLFLGQSTLYSGTPMSPRIIVRDFTNQKPIEGASIRIQLTGNGISRQLGQFTTNAQGSISEPLEIPDLPDGDYKLIIDSRSTVGKDHIENPVRIKKPYKIYVTADKPVYQPGQTVHMRVMVLNKTSLKPFAGQAVIVEVEDPKGNKIFKEEKITSDYGIASADFDIAREVNLGRYRVRVVVGNEEAEKIVTIEKYVLPKYKVQVSTDHPFYLPAGQLKGNISAQYFFGKPVEDASVEITGNTIIEKTTEIFKIKGTTNSEGLFSFQTTLSDYFTGIPLAGGNAVLRLEACVKDTAGHEEKAVCDLIIAQNPIQISILPESGRMVPNVENILYIMTTYPHGEPAVCTGNINGRSFETDTRGVAVFKMVPKEEQCNIRVSVQDKEGKEGEFSRDIKLSPYSENFLLRTDKAIYQAGQTLETTLLSSQTEAVFFIDIIKDRQTILTRTVEVKNGIGRLDMDLPPSLFGTLKLNAYCITSSGESKRSSRIVHVSCPRQLGIQASLDQETYQPAQSANISFLVSDLQGKPVPAALSLCAVDEAVFYVGENRPGLLKQFFEADEELLKPAYQTEFMISPDKLLSADADEQNLAKALFANITASSDPWDNLDKLREMMEPEEFEYYKTLIERGGYDALLVNPRYKMLLEYSGAGAEDYTLKAATFSQKQADSQKLRDTYFSILTITVVVIIVASFFTLILCAVVYSGIQMLRESKELDETRGTICKALNRIRFSSVLYVLIPFIIYPLFTFLGSVIWDIFYMDEELWVLFAFLIGLIINILLLRKQLTSCFILAANPETSKYASWLFVIPIFFIIQYITTRMVMFLAAVDYSYSEYGLIALLVTLVATLFILILSFVLTKRIAFRLQMTLSPRTGVTWIWICVIIAVMVLLFAVSMPTLSMSRSFEGGDVLNMELDQMVGSSVMSFADGMLHKTDITDKPPVLEKKEEPLAAPARIRRYFPETLFWEPELITDENGKAMLTLPLADSITTWKMNVDAVSAQGQLGSDEKNITVFQDFFVDLDLPVCLTQNDEISIPVLCYNYLAAEQQIRLNLEPQSWYSLLGVDAITINLGPNEVKSASFIIKTDKVGSHQLTVHARGRSTGDAVQRTIEVRPDGTEIADIQEGTLISDVEHAFVIPGEAIADSQSLILKLYPTAFSVLVEGLDNIFQKPYGCFEQTSSVTYPNVMALQYMKDTGQITPEVEVKARKYINEGYQRLLTFEVGGGGFDWFGHSPANELLTAYGLMEFSDMAKVHNVDSALIQRTAEWLLSKQKSDGSWNAGQLHGTLSAVQGELMTTAYITWALVHSGRRGQEINNAFNYLRNHRGEIQDPYIMALCANAFLSCDSQDSFGKEFVAALVSKFKEDQKTAFLSSQYTGAMYSTGPCLDIETTALGTLSMLKCNRYPALVKKSLTWLSEQKDQYGTWYSTHATILALKALIAGSGTALGSETAFDVSVNVNDRLISTVHIEPQKSDVMNFISLTDSVHAGTNRIRLASEGDHELPYQIVGSYWIPEKEESVEVSNELDIDVSYDKQQLKLDDTLICQVKVVNNKNIPINMAIVDLGIPPGFDVDYTAFRKLVEKNVLAKYDTTGNQCILYLRDIRPKVPLEFQYSLKAKYPIKAKIPESQVYEYYNPQNRDISASFDICVVQ